MYSRNVRSRISLRLLGLLLALGSCYPSQLFAQTTQGQVRLPAQVLRPPRNSLKLSAKRKSWIKASVRPSGKITIKLDLPANITDQSESLCSLNVQFASTRNFRQTLADFSIGAANVTRGKFSARMRAVPKTRGRKTVRRLFIRVALYCPYREDASLKESSGSVITSRSRVVRFSRVRIKRRVSLDSFIRSFVLRTLRRSAYIARARFTLRALSTQNLESGPPVITGQTKDFSVDPASPRDIVAYAEVTGTPPLRYAWYLIDNEDGVEFELTSQNGFYLINEGTSSTIIAYGNSSKLVGTALRLKVRNNVGEAISNLIPLIAKDSFTPTATPSYTPTATYTRVPGQTPTATKSATPTEYAVPIGTSIPSPSSTATSTPTTTLTQPQPTATPTYTPTEATVPTGTAVPTPSSTATSTPTTTPTQPQFGYDSRPSNTTCLAPERGTQTALFSTSRVFSGLAFDKPVKIAQAPADPTRFYVAEQSGVILSFQNTGEVADTEIFLDLGPKVNVDAETGLMGFAFHPKWPTIPLVFVAYVGGDLESRLSSFETRDGGATIDPSSEQPILTVTQPKARHTIGDLQFGPDGLLYVGLGDGALPPKDSNGNSQNSSSLLGKLLRINVDDTTATANYAIPTSNPYSSGSLCGTTDGTSTSEACAEIFASGFRNPWRFSVDPVTNQVWVGDVGQSAVEEVNNVIAGGNYGWNCREGTRVYVTNCGQETGTTLTPPIAQYSHSDGGYAVTGGYVYRGNAIPELSGQYLFGDYVTGNLWSIPLSTSSGTSVTSSDAVATQLNIVSFGVDLSGEIYVLDYSGGGIHKIVPPQSNTSDGVAAQLSSTGCVDPEDPTQPAAGLIPFEPIAPLWSDGSHKQRWIGLPAGSSIIIINNGDFQFPPGTVLMKNFSLNNKLIETRLLMRHPDGIWAGYSYQWNDEQTEANLLINGSTDTVQGQTWTFPSSSQCMACHTQPAGRSLGPETLQLNSDLLYPQTNRLANQLLTLEHIKLFNSPLSSDPNDLPALSRPLGSTGTPNEQARSYLHSNCSHCHQPGGGAPVNIDLRFSTPLAETAACDQPPLAGNLNILDARIIAPGAPERSVLVSRMNRRDEFQMPPLGSHLVDEAVVRLISEWIQSLPNCD